jgi:molybdopterin converting factor small subunit
MAEVVVRYFGILRELAGKRVETIKIEDEATLIELVRHLITRHDPKFKNFLFHEDGNLSKSLAFAVDGDSIPASKLSTKKCREVGEFVILPPISGGTN